MLKKKVQNAIKKKATKKKDSILVCELTWSRIKNRLVCDCERAKLVPRIVVLSPMTEALRGAVAVI